MSLLQLKSKVKRKKRKTLGRGNGSGHGTFSGKGCKGQKARSGGSIRPGFEGGQTPFTMKMPKLRGFKNPNKIDYQIINLGQLNIFEDNETVDLEKLFKKNLISKKNQPIKLLGGKGDLKKSLTIIVNKASHEAKEKLEKSKGTLQLV